MPGLNSLCPNVQVLSLEARMNDQQQQQAATDKLLQRAKAEAQHAQHALRTAQQDAAGPAGPHVGAGPFLRSPASGGGLRDRGPSGMLDTDSWAEPASVEVSALTIGCQQCKVFLQEGGGRWTCAESTLRGALPLRRIASQCRLWHAAVSQIELHHHWRLYDCPALWAKDFLLYTFKKLCMLQVVYQLYCWAVQTQLPT